MNTFEKAINFTLGWEAGRDKKGNIREDGGLNLDDGSTTKWGIRQAAHPTVDVPSLTLEAAVTIYRTKYWDVLALDTQELGYACACFDTAVNCGTKKVRDWMGKIEASKNKDPAKAMIQLREAFYFDLESMNREKYHKFMKGWLNRTNDLKKYIDIIRVELLA